jgi:hypothetical protein
MPAADREPFDQLSFYGEPKTRISGRRNSTARAHLDFGLNDVFIPIPAAGGNVPRQSKSRQGRHGNVVGTADSRLQHPSAPNGNAAFSADIVHSACTTVSANPAQLDIDDPAGLDFKRGLSVTRIVDALIQTN